MVIPASQKYCNTIGLAECMFRILKHIQKFSTSLCYLEKKHKHTNLIRHRTCVPLHLAFCSRGKHEPAISLYTRIVAGDCWEMLTQYECHHVFCSTHWRTVPLKTLSSASVNPKAANSDWLIVRYFIRYHCSVDDTILEFRTQHQVCKCNESPAAICQLQYCYHKRY